MRGTSKIQVRRLCEETDVCETAFLERLIEGN